VDSALIKVKMTGEKLVAALNSPPAYAGQPEHCVYAFSGLRATVAPWNEKGEQYLSVTLADGTEIEPGKTYTVAFWQGMVSDEFIQETVETDPGTYAEFLKSTFSKANALTPPEDGRMKLVWN